MARRALLPVLVLALGVQFGVLLTSVPGRHLRSGTDAWPFLVGGAAAVIVTGIGLLRPRGAWRSRIALILSVYVALGLWMFRVSPAPFIDVWSIHQASLRALMHGVNPYAITLENIYGHTTWYPPGAATAERLLFGYVYPPWSLMLGAIGYGLAGDFRYAWLGAMALSAALTVACRPGSRAIAAVGLLLFTPRSLFFLEMGWTEPTVLLPLAAAVFFASRGWLGPMTVALGVLGCAKQYSLLAAPAVLLLRPLYPSWKALGAALLKMVLVAAVVSLPLAFWDLGAFWHEVYGMQFRMPFRGDSLSLPVWWMNHYGSPLPRAFQLLAPLVLGAGVITLAPRTPAGFAWAVGTIYFVFFLFREGFCNHYMLVLAAYCLAAAAARLAHSGDAISPEPPHRSR